MQRPAIAASILWLALLACQSAPTPTALPKLPPTSTPVPPSATPVPLTATPTPPRAGITGTVKYRGTKSGSILVFVGTTESASSPMGAESTKSFTDVSGGEFGWGLPAGTYYVGALLQPGGPPSIEFPFITCGPIEVKSNAVVKIEIVLTDATTYGKPRDCGVMTP
jgi:hypothetical protein